MRGTLLLVALLAACAPKHKPVAPAAEASREERAVVELRRAFLDETGVRLHVYGLPGETPPPVDDRVEETPVDLAVVPTLLPVVREVLLTYPREVRTRLVPDLWLVGGIRALGHGFLGFAHPGQDRLDVVLREGTDPLALAGTMHHEISHLLQRDPRFDLATWRSFSAGSYVGLRPGTKWPREGRPWLRHGFVVAYGSKNPSEDFATYVEAGFTHPRALVRLAEAVDLIRRKLDFVTETYRRLAPGTPLPWADR